VAFAAAAGAADTDKAPATAPPPPTAAPLAVDLTSVPEIFPNASVSGTLGAGAPRFFKVFANRSLAAPETLSVTLEATGSLFGVGSLGLYDPEQVLLDELFTRNPGDLDGSLSIVPETGYYLIVVAADASYTWAVTVNWTAGGAFPSDNDNDLGNATLLAADSGSVGNNVTDWDDLVDLYAIDLAVAGSTSQALLVNLTSPNIADLDLFIYHLVGGVAVLDGISNSPFGTEYAAALPPYTGRYFVRVMSYQGNSAYTLEWGRFNVSADHNSDPPTATALTAGSFANNLSRWDLRDLYVLSAPALTTLNVSIHTEGFNATLRLPDLQAILWDANFSRVTWSYDFDPDERINALLPTTGTYYLDIFGSDPTYYLWFDLSFNYTMTVSIDRPPALSPPAWNFSGPEDGAVDVDLLTLIPPDPAGEALSFELVQWSPSLRAALQGDGHTLRVTPGPDWSGDAAVTVAATDRWQRMEIVLPLHFAPVNDPPRLASGASPVVFTEDGQALLNLSLFVLDPEGDPVSLLSTANGSTVDVSVAGGYIVVAARPDFSGASSFSLRVSDGIAPAADLVVAVSVTPVNDAPRFVGAPGPFAFDEDALAPQATFNLSGLAVDPDGDPITYSLHGAPDIASLAVGTALSLYPNPDLFGMFPAFLWASDGNLTGSAPVVIEIRALDDAPTLAAPAGPLLAREGTPFSFTAEADDIDTPLSSLEFMFSLDGGAASSEAVVTNFEHTFSLEDGGFHVLRVTVSDGNLSSSTEYTVFVSETNRAPVAAILTPRNATLPQGAVISFTARATDPDGTPVNITWVVDGTAVGNTPAFSLDRLPPGRHTVQLLVFDGELTATDTAEFEVQGGLPAPGAPFALLALAAGAALLGLARPRGSRASANAPKKLK
jgi:hypothetical protein